MYRKIRFSDCDLEDPFCDSLKEDYLEFPTWFGKKAEDGAEAYVSIDDGRIQAFVYVKEEHGEAVGDLPAEDRLKIGTLKICSDFKGQRLGEGGIGLALWEWQRSPYQQIYLTVYPKHDDLIGLIESFGFYNAGNKGGELVYVKDKRRLDSEDTERAGFRSFPYIDPEFRRGVYLPIKAAYHDNMFPYSTLRNTAQSTDPMPVANGISKAFIATPNHTISYRPGDIVLVYRMAETDKTYKSVITSYCTVSTVEWFKTNGRLAEGKSWEGFVKAAGNKTVYDEAELKAAFEKRFVCIITLVYNGYFGQGHNVNNAWLRSRGLFDGHPYDIKLTREEVYSILKEGGIDEKFAVFDKPRTRDQHNEREQEVRIQEDEMP